MRTEIAVGAGIAIIVILGINGLDLTPFFLLGGLVAAMFFVMDGRALGGRKFEVGAAAEASSPSNQVTFEDIGGQEVAKREFLEALEFMQNHDDARKLGIRPLKGVLLSGPPGTGKTLLAKAAANHTGSVFLATSGSQFVEMYAGVGARRVRELFRKAKTLALQNGKNSAIVFVDEIEVLGGKRGQHSSHLEYDQTLNELLVQMDGIDASDSVRILVVGATNRVDLLDSALLRPGRFDRLVKVDLPDKEGRLHILKIHAKNKPLDESVDLAVIAKETFGFSGAHLESLLNEAAVAALRRHSSTISHDDLREAMEKVMMGERLERRPSREEMTRVAYHECGHALMSELVRAHSVASVTITSRGRALGYMRQSPKGDQYIYTKDELLAQIQIALGGAVAEEIVFGQRSTGAEGDLNQVLDMCRRLIYGGMSSLGVIGKDMLPTEKFHDEVKRIVTEQEDKVRGYLEEKRAVMDKVVEILLREEKIPGDVLRSLIKEGTEEMAESCGGPA